MAATGPRDRPDDEHAGDRGAPRVPRGAQSVGGCGGPSRGPPRRQMTMPDVAIRIRALTKRYGDVEAVRGIDLDVRAGEIFGLIGPDGAGKTSTFQILGGVMQATAGTADLLGQPARQARAYVGYLTQAFSLYQDLSVAENLRYVGELRRVPVREIERRGQRYLTMFGMERFMDRLAGRLSGGMKQKLRWPARWWPSRKYYCWTSRRRASTRSRVASSGTRSRSSRRRG